VILISEVKINFLIGNGFIILVAILFLIYSTWIKALILGIFKIILDIVLIFSLDKDVEESILGFSFKDSINLGWTLRRRKK